MPRGAPRKKVYTGIRLSIIKGTGVPVRIAFKVIERTIDKIGQILLIPDIEFETYYTSLPVPASTVISLYREHGTSEQFHSEIKTELDLERLPSGKFVTNDLVLHFGLFTYNLLQTYSNSHTKYDYLSIEACLSRQAVEIKLSKHNRWLPVFERLYYAFY